MVTFLFWNLKRKPLERTVASLAYRHEADVVLLAECTTDTNTMLLALNRGDMPLYYYLPGIGCDKVTAFARFPAELAPIVREESRMVVRHMMLPGLTSILLVCVHLPSRLHWDEGEQAGFASEVARHIRMAEDSVGHSRTVLVGDFNMNPFERGLVQCYGFHAVMCKRVALAGKRRVQQEEHPFFYNPMWNLLGDETPGPPGTYYYSSSAPMAFFWNMFDQVLVRPDLLGRFFSRDLEILVSDGDKQFLGPKGIPDEAYSDHLPLLFRFRL